METSRICMYERQGKCKYGSTCRYSHSFGSENKPARTACAEASLPLPPQYPPRQHKEGHHKLNPHANAFSRPEHPPRPHPEVNRTNAHQKSTSEKSRLRHKNKEIQALHYQKRPETRDHHPNASVSPTKPPASATASDAWMPPENLQKIERKLGYSLFFPLELTNKDYLRRVLDICSLGIRRRVLEITAERHLERIPTENDRDVYYLLKQILGGKEYDDPANLARVMVIRQHFVDGLGTSADKLVNAAKFLLLRRNQLAHASAGGHSQDLLLSSFAYGVELLECFGKSAAAVLNSMHDLAAQYKEHQQFKQDRLEALGWRQDDSLLSLEQDFFFEDEDTSVLGVEGVDVSQLVDKANEVRCQVETELQPENVALTHLSLRLVAYVSVLQETISQRSKERNYEEAERVKRLRHSVQSLLSNHQFEERLDHQRVTLIDTASRLVASLVAQEEEAVRREDFLTPVTGAAALHELGDSLMRAKDDLSRELTPFPYRSLMLEPSEVLDGWGLWVRRAADSSLLGLARAATRVALLRDAHSRWHRNCAGDRLVDELTFDAGSLRGAGYSASELVGAGYTATELKDAGYSAAELLRTVCRSDGKLTSDLTTAGCEVSDMKEAGFGAGELASVNATDVGVVGFAAVDLLASGFSLTELCTADCGATELKAAEYSATELRAAGYSALQLKTATFDLRSLKLAGYDLSDLTAVHYTVEELSGGGFTLSELQSHGFSGDQLLAGGYTLSDLRNAGYAVHDFGVRFNTQELMFAGYSVAEIHAAGYTAADFKKGLQDAVSQWTSNKIIATERFGHISKWDVSGVTSMEQLFKGSTFNDDISQWDVSQVTNMSGMFYRAERFNQPLEAWNVSQVTNMSDMFDGAYQFNQPLEAWDVSQVTNMRDMFNGALTFNQPLSTWNVSQVTNMSGMFLVASRFNQPLGSWNVSQVTNMSCMFYRTASFNQPLEAWNVSRVTDMSCMFSGASSFNQPLEAWDVRQVTNWSDMFSWSFRSSGPCFGKRR